MIEGIITFDKSIRWVVSHTFFRAYRQYFFATLHIVLKIQPKRLRHFNAFSCVEVDIKWLLTFQSDVLYFKKFLLGVHNDEGDTLLDFVFFKKWVVDGFGSVVYGLLIRNYILRNIVFVENLKRIASHVTDGESWDKGPGLLQFILAFTIALKFVFNNFDKIFDACDVFLGEVYIDFVSDIYFNHTVSLVVVHYVGFEMNRLNERLPAENLIVEVAYLQSKVPWEHLVRSIDVLINITLC